MKILFFICIFFFSFNTFGKSGPVTGLDMPRFVSLKSDNVNLRVGPSTNYPITIKYITKNLPLEIIDEFDTWRKTKDHEGTIGWLHKSLIKGDRFILTGQHIDENVNIYKRPNGKMIGLVKKNNILDLKKCVLDWCKVNYNGFSGWLLKKNIWGVYKTETYNIKFYQPIINQYWRVLNSKMFD